MPKTLLVVDDSPTIRETARLALAGEDWVVVGAATAEEAMELLWAQPPAAVLCDADLAGEGVELCRKLRALPEGAELPILLMGATVTPAAASAAGATATLPKPFGADELTDALQAALDAQGFSVDLDALGTDADAPLTLEDLEIPFAAPAATSARETNEVEIIDLSGDEDYEELELIEDLEPLETAGEEAAVPLRVPATEALSFDADDLFASPPAPPAPEPAKEEAEEEIDLDALFATAEETATVEAPEGFLEERTVDDTRVLLGEISGITRAPVASWDAPAVPEEPCAPAVEDPFSYEPKWDEPGTADRPATASASPDASTEQAVRQALAESLSLENLTPTVERVVERVVWEVVPRLAERLIREAIERLQAEPPRG